MSATIGSGVLSPHGAGLPRLSLRMRCPAASSSWARRSTGPRMSYRTFLSLLACSTMSAEPKGCSGQVGGQQLGAGHGGCRGGGHGEPEDAAAARVGLDAYLAAVQVHDPPADGQAEAGAGEALGARSPVERRED